MVTRLKVEKAQVEASLREEEAKCGLLLKEVKESNEVRFFCPNDFWPSQFLSPRSLKCVPQGRYQLFP